MAGQRDDRTVTLQAEQAVLAHLQKPGAYFVALQGEGSQGSAAAVVDGSDVFLVADGIAKDDRSKSVYVPWAAHTTGPMVAVGTFDVAKPGVSVMRMTLPQGMVAPEQLGVTQEAGRTAPPVPGAVIGSALYAKPAPNSGSLSASSGRLAQR